MQLFMILVNDWKLLIIVKKSFTLNVYGFLDPTLVITELWFVSQNKNGDWWIDFGFLTNLNVP